MPPVASIGNRYPFLVAFRSARFRFRLRTVSHVELPAEKGSTFHGATSTATKRGLVDQPWRVGSRGCGRPSRTRIPIPRFVERDLRKYLECDPGPRLGAPVAVDADMIAYPCKGRGICPSCNTRRMVETAAHSGGPCVSPGPCTTEVLSLPKRLRYFLHHEETTHPGHDHPLSSRR